MATAVRITQISGTTLAVDFAFGVVTKFLLVKVAGWLSTGTFGCGLTSSSVRLHRRVFCLNDCRQCYATNLAVITAFWLLVSFAVFPRIPAVTLKAFQLRLRRFCWIAKISRAAAVCALCRFPLLFPAITKNFSSLCTHFLRCTFSCIELVRRIHSHRLTAPIFTLCTRLLMHVLFAVFLWHRALTFITFQFTVFCNLMVRIAEVSFTTSCQTFPPWLNHCLFFTALLLACLSFPATFREHLDGVVFKRRLSTAVKVGGTCLFSGICGAVLPGHFAFTNDTSDWIGPGICEQHWT